MGTDERFKMDFRISGMVEQAGGLGDTPPSVNPLLGHEA